MVQKIDFLPESYRQNRQRRKKTIWRRCVLVVFLSMIVAGSLQQRQLRNGLIARRNQMLRQAEQMMGQLENAGVLKKQIAQLDAKANLCTLFRMRVPTTRLLASVTNALPPYVTLTEFRATFDKVEGVSSSSPKLKKPVPDAASAPPKFPEELDFERLQERGKETALYVSLRGLAPNDVAISAYLGSLEETGVFDDVKLLFTDQRPYREETLRSFGIRLRVRKPGSLPPGSFKAEGPRGPVASGQSGREDHGAGQQTSSASRDNLNRANGGRTRI